MRKGIRQIWMRNCNSSFIATHIHHVSMRHNVAADAIWIPSGLKRRIYVKTVKIYASIYWLIPRSADIKFKMTHFYNFIHMLHIAITPSNKMTPLRKLLELGERFLITFITCSSETAILPLLFGCWKMRFKPNC